MRGTVHHGVPLVIVSFCRHFWEVLVLDNRLKKREGKMRRFFFVPSSSPNYPRCVKNDDAGGVQEEEPIGSVPHVADAVSRVRGGGGGETGQGGGGTLYTFTCAVLCVRVR